MKSLEFGQAAVVQGVARVATQPRDGGSGPTSPLHSLQVQPIPIVLGRRLIKKHHYLKSLPGGTKLSFGVFLGERLLGCITFGVGPYNAHSLVEGAIPGDCLALTRLWFSVILPMNSESRVLGVVLRSLRRYTNLKFVVTYADPAQGHRGSIYWSSNWVYTGLSEATPLYDVGDGHLHHSRSSSHSFGTRSFAHFAHHGVDVRRVPQQRKHRYVYFLDPAWRSRLQVPVLPYPKAQKTQTNAKEITP